MNTLSYKNTIIREICQFTATVKQQFIETQFSLPQNEE